MIKNRLNYLRDLVLNFFSRSAYQLSYIVESRNWAIYWDGKYITKNLNKLGLIRARISTHHFGIKDQIIHFGSINLFLKKNNFWKPDKSNNLVVTWFHLVPGDKKNKNILKAQKYLRTIHTSCNITKDNLINLGVNPEKIVVIPLGVDLSLFKPVPFEEKQKMRRKLKIPLDKVIIGSFQKDGVGWGKGMEPKLIKGPDILIKVLEKLIKNYPIFILLAGPARGYVKNKLREKGIPYKDIGYIKEISQIRKYYQVLDLYLITSRIEGGPKQILEAMASGIPVVSTKVGMVPDIIENGKEALLTEFEEIDQIVIKAQRIIEDEKLKRKLIENGLKKVENFSWDKIAQKYFQQIYSKLL